MQPLDVAIFGPLKRALSHQISRLLRSGITRIQKAEWLERYIEAREQVITETNILAGWRGAGLFPENMHRILQQLSDNTSIRTTPAPPSTATNNIPNIPTSSPPEDLATLQSRNQAFLAEISQKNIDTPTKIQVRRLTGMTERLQADVTILKADIKEIKEVHAKRKERQSRKRITFKNRPLLSSEDIAKALEVSEKATKAKKKAAARNRRNRRNRRKKAISSDEDVTSSASDSSDSSSDSEVEMLDCIVVS